MARTAKSSRLFENDWLEAATHVHPVTPLVLWVPVISYLFYLSIGKVATGEFVALAFGGLLIWTLTEYLMHRVVFHYDAKSKFGKTLVFLFHGIHHNEPEDATRLVMPPVPAIVLASMLYAIFFPFLGAVYIKPFFAFFMIGYLCYDYIHYGTHHFACKGPVMKFLKRYHMLHHYGTPGTRFGVSSPLWDLILGTYEKDQKSYKKSPDDL